ncbi:MAG: hypothetical protein IJU03_09635 [Thermoguttaceae bacterium]|nr:hypothetical protein [Thermoguttaceae bacterium]
MKIFSRHALSLLAFTGGRDASPTPKSRRARFERLETRELLAVTLAEYAQIRADYAEFALPESSDAINVIEIPADALTSAALANALDAAGSTRAPDLIVVRTTDAARTIAYSDPGDELKYELDEQFFGSTSIVALGTAPLELDAANASRALSVAVGRLNLGNILLANGSSDASGGVVFNSGTLTLKNCSVVGGVAYDRGGALYTTGELVALNTSFVGSQGTEAIYATGNVALTDCSISNSAGAGLYVDVGGAATVVDTTISACEVGVEVYLGELSGTGLDLSSNRSGGLVNSGVARLSGGRVVDNGGVGLFNKSVVSDAKFPATLVAERVVVSGNAASEGAGLYNYGGLAELTSCAFWANAATDRGGAIYNEQVAELANKTTLVNCTVAGNSAQEIGGGVYNDLGFSASLYNTLVAQNYAGDVDSNLAGEATQKNSIIGGNPEFVVGPIFDVISGALVNGSGLDLRPTRNSIAVNAGDSARVGDDDLDLSGAPRLYGRVDVGAYEYQGTGYATPSRSLVVTTLEDKFAPEDGQTSLREALYWSNGANSRITFASNLSGAIKLNSQLVATSGVEIDGDGRVTLDGQNASRALVGESNVTLRNLTLANGATSSVGGAVYAREALTIDNANFLGGLSAGHGGHIYARGVLTISNTSFANAQGDSAIYARGDVTVVDSVVTRACGVGLYIATGTAELSRVAITQNGGVGLVNDMGALTLVESTISENAGVGLLNGGFATVDATVFIGNGDSGIANESVQLADGSNFTANLTGANLVVRGNIGENGGGLINRYGRVTLTNSEIAGNTALSDGGGLYNEWRDGFSSALSLTNCTVAGNVAQGRGGGIASPFSNAALFIYETIVSQNYAGDVDSNLSGESSAFYGSYADGSPGFLVPPIFDYQQGKLLNLDKLNLRLGRNSVVIDTGSSSDASSERDLDGEPRVYGAKVDPGAYEYRGDSADAPSSPLVVTTLRDVFDLNDSQVSLREALFFAQDENATITFAPGVEGTAQLNSQLVISANVTIDGDSRVTLDAQSGSRVALVEAPTRFVNIALVNGSTSGNGGLVYARADVEFNAVTASSGHSDGRGGNVYALGSLIANNSSFTKATGGAAIYASGNLALDNSQVVENENDGIHARGNSAIVGASIKENGGVGVRNEGGVMTLVDVAISGSGSSGLVNLGEATLTSCTINANDDSGVVNGADESNSFSVLKIYGSIIRGNISQENGGALLNLGGAAELYNVDLSGNIAPRGAGVYNAFRSGGYNSATLVNCTVAGNSATAEGGGLYADATEFSITLHNSIVAKNYAKSGVANLSGGTVDARNSLTSGTPSFQQDPVFNGQGALTNPTTYNLALTRTSVCVDAGDNAFVKGQVDAAGAQRISNIIVDLGAYEYYPEHSTIVTTLDDSFDLNDGELSLREALYLAQDGDVISFLDSLSGDLALTTPLVNSGKTTIFGSPDVVVNGRYETQLIQNSGDLTLLNLTLANGKTSDFGGAISNTGTLVLENTVVRNSESPLGGAIYNGADASLTVKNSRLVANYADEHGGAVYNAGIFRLVDSFVTDNRANESGGALYNAGTTTVVNSQITNNLATNQGGAVYDAGYFYATNATIAANEAAQGGGVYAASGSLRFYNTILATNIATSDADFIKVDASVSASCSVSGYAFASGSKNVLYTNTAPLFVDGVARNYRLAEDSVAVDLGSDMLALQAGLAQYSTDLTGERRILGRSIDAGAYELAVQRDDVLYATIDSSFTLETEATTGQRVFWDLSGTGDGEYSEGAASITTSARELNLRPGEYEFRTKTVDSKGATVAEKTIYAQLLDVPPSVRVDRTPIAQEGVVVFTINAFFSAPFDQHSWRVDWGDGTSGAFTTDVFTAGKIYAPSNTATSYNITLTLLDANRFAEYVFYLDAVSAPVEKTSDARLDQTPVGEFPAFEEDDLLLSAAVDEIAAFDSSDMKSTATDDALSRYYASNATIEEYDVVGVESTSFGKRKRTIALR